MPSTSRRPAARRGQGDKLRGEIMQVTARQLEEFGDARALSLRAIAREVGVAATSIYLHFDSLEAAIRAVKDQMFEEFGQALVAGLDAAPADPRARLRALAAAYVEFALARPGTYKVLFSTRLNLRPDPEHGDFYGQGAFGLASDALRAARDSDDDIRLLTTQMWCLMHGIVTLRADHPIFPWQDVDAQLDDLVHRMIDA